jgi:tRNA-Thr(GGU) m(6)t(6)A37 methyltransferase TsaA
MTDNPETYTFPAIGVVRSPHHDIEQTPIQPVFAKGIKGTIEVFPDYEPGLSDLEGFEHIYLLYVFHSRTGVRLRVRPFLDDVERGVFATRAPCRPNPIGMSVLKLIRREGSVLHVEDIDVLDGTPVLDIKPYVTRFDARPGSRNGWLDRVDPQTFRDRGARGDKRFIEGEAEE